MERQRNKYVQKNHNFAAIDWTYFSCFINSNLETKQALEYNAYLKDYDCKDSYWEFEGRKVVKRGYKIINLSKSLNEDEFSLIEIPSRVEDIRCDWAENLYMLHKDYFRIAKVNIGYPADEELVDCFCKGFVTAAENYISENNWTSIL